MIQNDDNRWFRILPLHERNWVVMIMALLVLAMAGFAAVLLWASVFDANSLWVWLSAIGMTIVSLLAIMALITGESAWLLLSLIVSRNH